jgi:hypothetical protein
MIYLWKAFKKSQREELTILIELTFKRKILNCMVKFLKVFLYPPPPLEREDLIRLWSLIQKNSFIKLNKDL